MAEMTGIKGTMAQDFQTPIFHFNTIMPPPKHKPSTSAGSWVKKIVYAKLILVKSDKSQVDQTD